MAGGGGADSNAVDGMNETTGGLHGDEADVTECGLQCVVCVCMHDCMCVDVCDCVIVCANQVSSLQPATAIHQICVFWGFGGLGFGEQAQHKAIQVCVCVAVRVFVHVCARAHTAQIQ